MDISDRGNFELDAKLVIDDMQSTTIDATEFGDVIQRYKDLSLLKKMFNFCHVKRRANEVVHANVQAFRFYVSPTILLKILQVFFYFFLFGSL